MDTIRLTGPGLISKIVSEYLYSENNGSGLTDDLDHGIIDTTEITDTNNISENNISNNITIFPYYFLNPVPNTYTIELSDEKNLNDLKLKYIVKNQHEINNTKLDENKTEKCELDGDAHSTDTIVRTYAIHWWQRSWQEKKN